MFKTILVFIALLLIQIVNGTELFTIADIDVSIETINNEWSRVTVTSDGKTKTVLVKNEEFNDIENVEEIVGRFDEMVE